MPRPNPFPWGAPAARAAASALASASAIALAACGSDLALPPDAPAGSVGVALTAVRGDGQRGVVARPLPDPLTVRVTDAGGTAVTGLSVVFRLADGAAAGDVIPDTAVTDATGQASTHWVLGTVAGNQAVDVQVVGAAVDTPLLTFVALAQADAAAGIARWSGDGQQGRAGRPLAEPLVARVLDRFGNPVGGATVRWTVTGGNGGVQPAIAVTGADGTAATSWSLGLSFGRQTVTATADGVGGPPVLFTATLGS